MTTLLSVRGLEKRFGGVVATVWGGLVGAAVLLLLQEVLASTTEHPEFWTGWVLLAVVLFARQGIVGLWTRRQAPSLP